MTSEDSELTVKTCGRICRYRADAPCDNPLLLCEKCRHYIADTHEGFEKVNSLKELVNRIPEPHPYVKFTGPSGEKAIEIGIKGTF